MLISGYREDWEKVDARPNPQFAHLSIEKLYKKQLYRDLLGEHGAEFQDLTGQTFGYLTVLHKKQITPGYETRGHGAKGGSSWVCRCTCGNERVYSGSRLTNMGQKSCGCFARVKRSSPTIER